jgi:DNA-directed RNA polymerase specialized sigma24 family protein
MTLLKRVSVNSTGITIDDLVSAGWLGYTEAEPTARNQSYGYTRARFAMLDEIRRWQGCKKVGTGRRGGVWMWPRFRALPEPRVIERARRARPRSQTYDEKRTLEQLAVPARDEPFRLTAEQEADLTALFARTLGKTEEELMTGLMIEGESLAVLAERSGKPEQQLMVYRSRAIAKIRAVLAAGIVFLVGGTARAQSISIMTDWVGPVPGEQHAPIVHVSLGQLNSADGVKHWCVGCAGVSLQALAFGKDSATASPAPRVVWALGRAASARLAGTTFTCKHAGDTTVRVRWLDASGGTLAADSATIRCH